MENPKYIASDIPAQPLKAYLDENGTTIDLEQEAPTGATLTLDSSSFDSTSDGAPEQPQKPIHLTRDKIMDILRKMFASEQITRQQMLEMRRRFGISNASFHKKRVSKAKKKKARALAYKNKRTNRLNGSSKGEKRSHGIR